MNIPDVDKPHEAFSNFVSFKMTTVNIQEPVLSKHTLTLRLTKYLLSILRSFNIKLQKESQRTKRNKEEIVSLCIVQHRKSTQ